MIESSYEAKKYIDNMYENMQINKDKVYNISIEENLKDGTLENCIIYINSRDSMNF